MADWILDGTAAAVLPIADRGLQYGDGLFETIAVRNGMPRFLDRHTARLAAGLEALGFAAQPGGLLASDGASDVAGDLVSDVADEVARVAAGRDAGVAKVIVTRGSAARGYRPPGMPQLRRLVGSFPSTPPPRHYYVDGVELRVCSTPASSNPVTAGHKTLCRLDQVLARAEWDDPDIAEGLMLDASGYIVGGTMSNFFCVRNDCLLTPALDRCGIAGIMRAVVLAEAATAGLATQLADLPLDELLDDDELFLTNSQFGIWPVRSLAGRSRRVGPRTRSLMLRLAAIGVEECSP
ncbi:MAG: aminodeoxychorismate lyase [Gammaproteobacteria bacterium]